LDWRFDGLTALVSIAAGKAADLVVLAGNRAKNIDDVEK
jgi:imidazolonepropionase-like amidohydrolase